MEGVLPESRHFTPIIRAEALGGAVENATALIHEMASSTLGKQLGPSVDSFNALLEARCVLARRSVSTYSQHRGVCSPGAQMLCAHVSLLSEPQTA